MFVPKNIIRTSMCEDVFGAFAHSSVVLQICAYARIMSSHTRTKYHENITKLKHKYCGYLSENDHQMGTGCRRWVKPDHIQTYSGYLIHNNLHRRGIYAITKTGDQSYYDGLFFNNKLEGYGKVVNANFTIFEGLFKQNVRFGPGVLTYSNDSQDVGMWDGFVLRRLCVPIGEDVPRLTRSLKGKAEVLKFRTLIPLYENLLEKDEQFCNLNIRNNDSLFFYTDLYNQQFAKEECIIDVIIPEEEFELEIPENNECKCFDANLDNYTRTCGQLHDFEKKLQTILQKKELLEQQLETCKNCCNHIPPAKPKKLHIEKKTHLEKITAKSDDFYKKTLSFSSNLDNGQEVQTDLTKPEIELKNYFYINMQQFDKECVENEIRQKYSRRTFLYTHYHENSTDVEDFFAGNEEEEDEVEASDDNFVCPCGEITKIQTKLNSLIQEESFYTTVKSMLTKYLNAEYERMYQLSTNGKRIIKKVKITHLIAWNNETFWIETLRHCFRRRFTENNVSFKVIDLLKNNRKNFQTSGAHETDCVRFLEACCDGQVDVILNCVLTSKINPDLCDSRGNTGIFLATVKNQLDVIKILVNCGAKVDTMNDECLTPIAVALLSYLSLKLKVEDWEEGFLEKKESGDDLDTWPEDSSEDDTLVGDGRQSKQNYIFDLSYSQVVPPQQRAKTKKKKKKKSKKQKKKTQKGSKKSEKNSEKSRKSSKKSGKSRKQSGKNVKAKPDILEDSLPLEEQLPTEELNQIKQTVTTLLNLGADPNVESIPLKPIFLSIFTNDSDLLSSLLQANANPNTLLPDKNLTCLHIIASIKLTPEKVKMVEALLEYKADPDVKTNEKHWPEVRSELLGKKIEDSVDDGGGKHVLHVLSLRKDFPLDVDDYIGKIARLLLENGCNTNELYVGHTALSISVLRGNIKLIECLLKSQKVDPHQELGNGMGNALTVLILNRFDKIFDEETKEKIVDVLLENGLNPLEKIGDFDNTIAFMNNEFVVKKNTKKKGLKKRTKRDKSSKGSKKTKQEKSSKGSRKKKKTKTQFLRNYITEKSRIILFRHLQGKAVKFLYIFIKESIFVDPLLGALVQFLTPEVALDILELLFQHSVINFEEFDYFAVCDLMRFIQKSNDLEKIKRLVNTKMWNLSKETNLPIPEVDQSEDKYKICFECLLKTGKQLIKCPICGLVYFCSQECKIKNSKSGKYHKCDVNFDDNYEVDSFDLLLKMIDKKKRERAALIQIKKFTDEILNLKFITKKRKEMAIKLYKNFKKLKKEREDFIRINNLPNFKLMLVQDDKLGDENSYDLKFPIQENVLVTQFPNKDYSSIYLDISDPKNNVKVNAVATSPSGLTVGIYGTSSHIVESRIFSPIAKRIKSNEKKVYRKSTFVNFSNREKLSRIRNTIENIDDNRKVVDKRYYMELLSKIFVDFNLPLLLLPYACYKDGQVYYTMAENSGFYKLNIPD